MGDNNNIELWREEGGVRLTLWDWMHGNDQHYKIDTDGLVYRLEYDEDDRRVWSLVENIHAEMDNLLKQIEGNHAEIIEIHKNS